MSAATRPERRRKSSLVAEHPAFPAPEPRQPQEAPPTPDPDPAPAPEPEPEPPAAAEQPDPAPTTATPEPVAAAEPVSRAPTRTRARETTPRPREGTPAEARARKAARDAAFGYGAAARRADRRLGEWAEAMVQARSLGTQPKVLRGYIAEAAERAGLPESAIPDEIWEAAGLAPPEKRDPAR